MIVTCGECSRDFDVPAKPEDIQRWKHGELIQRAMPYLTADERELLITHTCGECFDAIFEENEEDDA